MLVPDLLQEGLRLFNLGKFYDAHEVWEDLWRVTSEPRLKTLYQGLIQAAVALHHLGRQNQIGARSQLQKSIRNLTLGSTQGCGLDISNLIRGLEKVLQEMPARPPPSLRIARLK